SDRDWSSDVCSSDLRPRCPEDEQVSPAEQLRPGQTEIVGGGSDHVQQSDNRVVGCRRSLVEANAERLALDDEVGEGPAGVNREQIGRASCRERGEMC